MDIRYVEHKDLDFHKWDSCVHFAGNSTIYGFSWYLNQICEDWDGLVEGNYESVFPIIWNDKIPGFLQLYNPQFAQQLGLYSVHALSENRIRAFLSAIPKKYKRLTINLNSRITVNDSMGFNIEKRPNYQLFLNAPYEEIAAGYSKNLKRNLKKAAKNDLFAGVSVSPETLIELFKEHQGQKIKDVTDKSYFTLLRIMYQSMTRGKGFITGVQLADGTLCAAAFFLVNRGKLTYLLPVTTPQGKEVGAMHYLLDILIRTNENSPKRIDFEGSGIESIARFYKSFGATDDPYFVIQQNRLPFWMRWFVK